jgi:hypothetical protein
MLFKPVGDQLRVLANPNRNDNDITGNLRLTILIGAKPFLTCFLIISHIYLKRPETRKESLCNLG